MPERAGLTGLYIGPADLSLSLGYEPQLDHEEPTVLTAIEEIMTAAHNAGIRLAYTALPRPYAKRMKAMGFDLVTLGTDVRLFVAAYAKAVAEMRSDC